VPFELTLEPFDGRLPTDQLSGHDCSPIFRYHFILLACGLRTGLSFSLTSRSHRARASTIRSGPTITEMHDPHTVHLLPLISCHDEHEYE